jgi:hypothetical protein
VNESEYYASEITDAELDAMADAGEIYLEEAGYNYRPTFAELDQMIKEGMHYVFTPYFCDHETPPMNGPDHN